MAAHNIYDLGGRVALIPGGLGGVGSAVTRLFAEAGATVVVAGSQAAHGELAVLRTRLDAAGERVSFTQADALDEAAVAA
ncbi:MAG TPA: SDR family NAD(P)-dependent oxidoreductase, partial [Ktedonobacterales bacterium]|nr:SDR family NAD(P)-dependent oxidoreductase [Ktedonobacterales bacterium]